MKTARNAAALIASLTLITAPVLTACEDNTQDSSSSSSAASDSSADSSKSDTKDKDSKDKDSKDKDSKDKDSKDKKTATSDTSPSQAGSSAKPATSDTQEITGSSTGLTFAVPKDWQDLKNLDPSEKERVAQTMGIDGAALDQQTAAFDVFYRAKKQDSTGFYNNVNMAAQTQQLTSVPSKSNIELLLAGQGATLKEYTTKQTAKGEAAVGTYTIQGGGKTAEGAVIVVPTSQPTAGAASYTTIYVSAGTADEETQITDTIIDTIH